MAMTPSDPQPNDLDSLTTPLLREDSSDEVVLDVAGLDRLGSGRYSAAMDGPYAFLGVGPLALSPPSPVDPFRNHTPHIVAGIYELAKIAVCVPIAAARLVLFGLALLVGYLATKLALEGWKDKHNPMPSWRRGLMWVTRLCARCILFSFGYHWIKRIGHPAPREIAPIVVSNHVSYIEPIFYFYELFPTMVASESHDSIPFVGTIIRAMQVIYVDRFSAPSRKHAVNEIKRKASCNEFPRVLLFPEGTTTNGRVLISFQLGAFIPGLPIQPVAIRYPHVHFDQSWGDISLAKLMFRMFTQFHNFMEVEYLPVIYPPPSKFETAIHFAEQTSFVIASALNVVQTHHSYGDLMLLAKASDHKMGKPSAVMVEMAWVRSMFNISTLEALEFLDKFLSMKPDSSGRVNPDCFLAAYKIGSGAFPSKIFDFLDAEQKGSITFRQFLLGSAHVMQQPMFHRICEFTFNACIDKSNCSLSIQKFSDVVKSANPCMIDELVYELFMSFDVDGDGVVKRDDFMTYMMRSPLLVALFVPHLMKNNSLDNV